MKNGAIALHTNTDTEFQKAPANNILLTKFNIEYSIQ